MSKIAVMEKHQGEELQKAREYYRRDYVAVQLLKNVCYLTVAYMIGLLLWGVANMDMLIEKLNRMQIKGILTGVIVSYLLCMTAGLLLTYVITMKRYFYGQELFRHCRIGDVYDRKGTGIFTDQYGSVCGSRYFLLCI